MAVGSRVYYRASSLTDSTTASATPAIKTRVTFSPTASSRYLVLAGCAFSCNLDNIRYVIRLLDPGNNPIRQFQARPDAPMTAGSTAQTYQAWTSALYTSPASPGTVNFTLDYALSSDSANQVLTVSQAWIVVIKLGATDYVDEDATRTITSSTTYTSKFSGNLPNVARNYVVIARGSVMNAHTLQNYNSSARMTLDGVTIGSVENLAMSYVLSGAECPLHALGILTATGNERYSFDYKCSLSSDATSLDDCFICALDMATLPDLFSDAKYTVVSTTSSTFQNRLSVAFTAAGANHVVLTSATVSINAGVSGRTTEMRVTRNGALVGETQGIATSAGADDGTEWSNGLLAFETLTPNTSYTYNLDYRSASGGTARLWTAAMVVIQLDGATLYDSTLTESTHVDAAQNAGLNALAGTNPESVRLGDIADQSSSVGTDSVLAAVAPGYAAGNSLTATPVVTEPVAVATVVDSVLLGSGTVAYADGVLVDATVDVGHSVDDSFQFPVVLNDVLTGGFDLTTSVASAVVTGDQVDAILVLHPYDALLNEAVTTSFGTDAQLIFPIPLSYGEIVYASDFLDVTLVAAHKITEAIQDLNQEDMVYLYTIDMNLHGLGVHYFTPHVLPNGVIFDNQLYVPIPIQASGFQRTSDGSMPKPKLQVGNIARTLVEYLLIHDDLIGSVVTRMRTYRRYLDDGLEPDPTAILQPLDIFVVDSKSRQDPVAVEFTLTPAIDQDGRQLPARRMIRDTCMWRYRQWDGKKFDYGRVECPYAGNSYFDEKGRPVTPAGDQCGKRLKDCRLRFGVNATLPYGGFPGAGKTSG
jgi:lambda family phage minor tail protein L